jgi:hypothetical protein
MSTFRRVISYAVFGFQFSVFGLKISISISLNVGCALRTMSSASLAQAGKPASPI